MALEKSFAKAMAKILSAQGKALKKALLSLQEKKEDTPQDDEELENESNDITDKIFILIAGLLTLEYYSKTLTPIWIEAAKRGIDFFNQIHISKEEDKVKYEDLEKNITDWMKGYSETQIGYINNTTKNQVQRIVKNGLANKDNLDKIANDLVQYIGNIANSRSRNIAETEIHNVFSKSNFLSATYKGFNNKTYMTVEDERVRPTHAAMDGLTINVSETFPNGGMYPGDPSLPAQELINCRCWLTYS